MLLAFFSLLVLHVSTWGLGRPIDAGFRRRCRRLLAAAPSWLHAVQVLPRRSIFAFAGGGPISW